MFVFLLLSGATVCLGQISLFSSRTWNNRLPESSQGIYMTVSHATIEKHVQGIYWLGDSDNGITNTFCVIPLNV